MKLIDDTDLEEFIAILGAYGFSSADFELSEQPYPTPTTPGVHTLQGGVEVRRRSNSLHCRYAAGHGTAWVRDFEADLAMGLYGVPDTSPSHLS